MALYIVNVKRTVEHFATIEVEAANADLAAEIVEKDARALTEGDDSESNVFSKAEWELEDDNIEIDGEIYTEDE